MQQKFADFKDYIVDKFSGVGTILRGIFTGNFDVVREGFAELGEGIGEIAEDVTETLEVVAEKGKQAFNQATEIQKLRNEVTLLEAEQRKLNFTYLKEQETQRQIRDDVSKTFEERMKANKLLGESLETQLEDEKAIFEEKLRLAKLEASTNENSIELKKAVIDAETELADLEERINGFRSEQMAVSYTHLTLPTILLV